MTTPLMFEKTKKVAIAEEMRSSYLDYSMSVIVGRALPDVRDGLKPVHRRLIYGMRELGVGAGKAHRKCARIVGDVMGKYHPHGDAAIYDTLVRLAQDFTMRYPLVDGQGNFGSIDGDTAAAMRYTEARLTAVAESMLADIEKETVDFAPNFDETLQEPGVLPSLLPNLLLNGADGIAVGMATKIPPHNLAEVARVVTALIDKPKMKLEQVAALLPGPDFPTGGLIVGRSGVDEAYRTGRGRITVRARVALEEARGDRERIIISEIPYQVNKTRLLEQIANLVKEKKIDGLSDLRDESDREGMRIVLELRRGANPQIILNQLYKHTQCQITYGVIAIALVDGQPMTLNLKDLVTCYIEHRREVVMRRTEFDLQAAQKRAHILAGFKIALDNLDAVISLIRKSKDVDRARAGLMKKFKLSEIQAQAILDLRLARLTALERQKVLDELAATKKLIKELKAILADEKKVYGLVKKEIKELAEKYGDPRRTEIVAAEGEDFSIEDLIAAEDMAVTLTHEGYIKRTPLASYKRQSRGTRGVLGHAAGKGEDFVEHLFVASTHAYLLFFTDRGKCYWLKVYNIPEIGRSGRGRGVRNLLELAPKEQISAVVGVDDLGAGGNLLFATSRGQVKKTPLEAYSRPKRGGIIALRLAAGDDLVGAQLERPRGDVVLVSERGKAIRFPAKEVRAQGRAAAGVRGMRLGKGDAVVGMLLPAAKEDVLVVSEKGLGKRTPLKAYRKMHRGGGGVITLKTGAKTGLVVGAKAVGGEEDVVLITEKGVMNRLAVGDISRQGRATQGVKVMKVEAKDGVAAMAVVKEDGGA
ncbi:MAG: DNA gyrase subunit A [Candidatus Coatesbacteria bacterium]|nr:MAG: DNA gyrase subunit A [Candidatus Coatesbacteria bacterium]